MSKPSEDHQDAMLRSVERLNRILEAAKLLNSTLDLSELTTIILRIVKDEVGTDRGTCFVLDRERRMLTSIVAQGIDDVALVLPIGQGIAGAVAATGDTINIQDAYNDPRFDSSFDATLGYRTNDIYCMPIVNRVGDIVGVLELMNRTRPITISDEEFLAGVSVHFGLALENAQMHSEIVEKRKIEQELVLAREIQQNFHPTFPPSCGGVEICASIEMCSQVGGDYIGYFPLKEGRFLITIGDVSGKGIAASLVMSSLHATCRALFHHVHPIEQITNILNQTLVETTSPQTFVTLLVVLVDPVGNRIHYIRCGHNPPFAVGGSGKVTMLNKGGGPPVGLIPRFKYEREIVEIEPGSVVVLFTDGVSEAEDLTEEQFGTDRLIEVVSRDRHRAASDIHESIRAALHEYIGEQPLQDDNSLIVLKFP